MSFDAKNLLSVLDKLSLSLTKIDRSQQVMAKVSLANLVYTRDEFKSLPSECEKLYNDDEVAFTAIKKANETITPSRSVSGDFDGPERRVAKHVIDNEMDSTKKIDVTMQNRKVTLGAIARFIDKHPFIDIIYRDKK